jgi:hypothetical protein
MSTRDLSQGVELITYCLAGEHCAPADRLNRGVFITYFVPTAVPLHKLALISRRLSFTVRPRLITPHSNFNVVYG